MSGLGIKPHFKVETVETDAGGFKRKRKFFYFCTDTISSTFGQCLQRSRGLLISCGDSNPQMNYWELLILSHQETVPIFYWSSWRFYNISKFLTQASSLLESDWGRRNVALNAHWCSHELLKRTENSLQPGEEFFSSVLINRHRPRFQTHLRRHTN